MRGFTSFTDLRPDPKNSMIKQGNNDPPSFESHEYKWHEKNIFFENPFYVCKEVTKINVLYTTLQRMNEWKNNYTAIFP